MRLYEHSCGYQATIMAKTPTTNIASCPSCKASPAEFKIAEKLKVQGVDVPPDVSPIITKAPQIQAKALAPKPVTRTEIKATPTAGPASTATT